MPARKSFKLPPKSSEPGLLIGYSLEEEHERAVVGFTWGDQEFSPRNGYLDPYIFHGEGHLMTIAPTGAGKGVSCVIPAALRHKGDLVVMDPKGENFAITARRRAEMGQAVCLLDPFGVTAEWEDRGALPAAGGIDILSLMQFLSDDEQTQAQSLAAMLAPGYKQSRDPYWDVAAQNIFSGALDAYRGMGQTFDRLLDDLRTYPRQANTLAFDDLLPRLGELPEDAAEILKALDTSGSVAVLVAAYRSVLQDVARQDQIEADRILEDLFDDPDSNDPKTTPSPSDHDEVLFYEGDQIFDDVETFSRYEQEISAQIAESVLSYYRDDRETNEPENEDIRYLLSVLHPFILNAAKAYEKHEQAALPWSDDSGGPISYPLAILKTIVSHRKLAQAVTAQVLSAPERTWGSMMSVLQTNIGYLQSTGVRCMLSGKSFDLDRFRRGTGTAIYIVFPPHKMASHATLLATIFKGLINVLCKRDGRPAENTLFLMDEVAQLGFMEEFIAAKTLLRGYGVQVWSFWQDISQLQAIYPNTWRTLINNCRVFQAFGCKMPLQAMALEQVFDIPREAIMKIDDTDMLLSVYGDDLLIARKPAYFSDPAFQGQFRQNPLHRVIMPRSVGKDDDLDLIEIEDDRPVRLRARPLG